MRAAPLRGSQSATTLAPPLLCPAGLSLRVAAIYRKPEVWRLPPCGRHDAGNLYHSARVISLVGEVSHSPPARHFPATSPTVGDRH
jgi:hypothetical protein